MGEIFVCSECKRVESYSTIKELIRIRHEHQCEPVEIPSGAYVPKHLKEE